MGRLDGKVAIVTGGARGQGAAESELFASEGATVIAADVLDDDGKKLAARTGVTFVHHDVTSEEDWERLVREVVERHGGLHILVNNAGIFRPGGVRETKLADYRRVIEVNQVGVFLGMREAAPAMIASGGGSIVNISSIAGMRGARGAIAYGASKWAVRGMTQSAATELGRHNIRVNSIHPGVIETPMLHEIPGVDARGTDTMTRRQPINRVAQPIEVARLALFLASDESSYCTGSEFIVDGGAIAGF